MSTTATVAKLAMVGLLGASVPVHTEVPDLWLQWGLAGVVVAFTLWRDHHRERRLSTAIEQHHAWTRDTLLDALRQNTAALEEVSQTLRAARAPRQVVLPDEVQS